MNFQGPSQADSTASTLIYVNQIEVSSCFQRPLVTIQATTLEETLEVCLFRAPLAMGKIRSPEATKSI